MSLIEGSLWTGWGDGGRAEHRSPLGQLAHRLASPGLALVTLGIYAQALPAMQQDAAERLTALLH